MGSTTRWKDTELSSFEDIISKFENIAQIQNEPDKTTHCNWKSIKGFDEIKKERFNGREIKYNYFSISFDSIRQGAEAIEDRTTHSKCLVIVYQNGSSINYIIEKNSTTAKTILRKILGYSGKKEVIPNIYEIKSDFFIWLISKVYYNQNEIEVHNEYSEKLALESIRSFKGDTDDTLNTVSASGESVMKIISTLSFLLESRNINQINIDVNYGTHKGIIVKLDINNSITITLEKYIGEYFQFIEEDRMVKLYLLFYLEIFPNLIQAYEDEKESTSWGIDANADFLKKVAADLQNSINEKLISLNNV